MLVLGEVGLNEARLDSSPRGQRSITRAQGVLRISSDRDDRIGAKIKTQKNLLGFNTKIKTKKSLDQDLTPKKSRAEFPSHTNFQKAVPRKIETLVLNTPKNPN